MTNYELWQKRSTWPDDVPTPVCDMCKNPLFDASGNIMRDHRYCAQCKIVHCSDCWHTINHSWSAKEGCFPVDTRGVKRGRGNNVQGPKPTAYIASTMKVWVVVYDGREPDQLVGSSYYTSEAKADVAANQFRKSQRLWDPWAVEVRQLGEANV